MLRSLDRRALDRLSMAGYMLARDLAENDFHKIKAKTRLTSKKLRGIVNEAKGVCHP